MFMMGLVLPMLLVAMPTMWGTPAPVVAVAMPSVRGTSMSSMMSMMPMMLVMPVMSVAVPMRGTPMPWRTSMPYVWGTMTSMSAVLLVVSAVPMIRVVAMVSVRIGTVTTTVCIVRCERRWSIM